jgi:uncharacterized RDD family membrane protein YckC
MVLVMNATAHASAAPTTGPKLDNRRVLAAIVDLAIVVAGAMVILFAANALSSDTGDVRGALSAVILGWALYYYFATESGDGQTVGKKLLKLRVVRADGRPAGMGEIAVRTILRVLDGVGGYIVALIVMLATGQRRQRLGDLAAGTIVVDASAPAVVPPAPVVAPIEEPSIEDEPEIPTAFAGTSTITLPSRPARPATLDDLGTPEAPVEDEPGIEEHAEAVAEPVEEIELDEPAFEAVEPVEAEVVAEPVETTVDPVAVEPAFEAAEPVEAEVAAEPLQDAPVEDAPVEDAPVEDEPVDHEPIVEEPLPDLSTPSLDELAHDVEAVRTEAVPVVRSETEDESDEDESGEDEPMTVKSVETVSAIDLVMGGAPEEDASPEPDEDPEPPAVA